MKIEKRKLSELNPAAYNPRADLKPGDPEYEKIRRSIEEFGYVDPIIINRDGTIIGGHQRFKILLAAGKTEAEVSVVDLDKTKEKALNIALNKTGGEWDMEKLKELIGEIDLSDLDATLTGFDTEEIKAMLGEIKLDPEEVEEDPYSDIEKLEKHYGVPYQGNKSRIADIIIKLLPEGSRLVDLFGGGWRDYSLRHAFRQMGKLPV